MLKLHHFEQEEPQMISPTDRDAVEKTLDGFTHVWNRHDMDAMAELVTGDCDWVNVVGMHWKGKATDIKLVAFHIARKWRYGRNVLGHRKADTVHQEQGRLVGNLAVPLDLQSRDALL